MSEYDWLDIFSNNLLDMMEEANVSQHELSRRTGIAQATISRYITKKQMPSVRAIVNISYALNCDAFDIIDFGDMID